MSKLPRIRDHAAPGEHLARLLAECRNPFEIGDALLARLSGARLCRVRLRSWRERNSPPPPMRCRTYRHTFVLDDGTEVPLWELQHDTDPDGRLVCEIYQDDTTLRKAERRVHRRMGDVPDDPHGCVIAANVSGLTPELLAETAEPPQPHAFTERDSVDHARRLIRRARHTGHPGEPGPDLLNRLTTARRHTITQIARRFSDLGQHSFCSVYEHTFLLADNREVSLYELEHDYTEGGRLVCELYVDEASAAEAAERHGHAATFDSEQV
ncbi:hypothetical protein GL263_07520 [Streptomyces durbertensis]|uniref:Uncharacterized protein n=1 Tax=Streptomyces durbertensis TaxID=2448886 RepID=A0ABR6EDJ5_9ACTN|nr:DUF6227 family protein [Streptomyces durbertensis]MBB1243411.1 hypothetical protein [Streptomyces durbertensis]